MNCADESKTYATVVIGTQTWMAENLAWLPSVHAKSDISSTDLRYYVYGYDGTSVNDAKTWSEESTISYSTYGVLYNYQAAIRVCPTGWHLPTATEWTTLENYLGTASAGTQLKSNSTHWVSGGAGTNSSKFSALPGGTYANRDFGSIGYYGFWWTATPYINLNAYCRNMESNFPRVTSVTNQQSAGYSVRCIKDN